MKHFFLALVCLCLSSSLRAQTLTVSNPIEGAVYQQNAVGRGKIRVTGSLNFLFAGFLSLNGDKQQFHNKQYLYMHKQEDKIAFNWPLSTS